MRTRLAGFEVAREIEFVTELPRNETKKVVKPKFREQRSQRRADTAPRIFYGGG